MGTSNRTASALVCLAAGQSQAWAKSGTTHTLVPRDLTFVRGWLTRGVGAAAPSLAHRDSEALGHPIARSFPHNPLPALVGHTGTAEVPLSQTLRPGARGTSSWLPAGSQGSPTTLPADCWQSVGSLRAHPKQKQHQLEQPSSSPACTKLQSRGAASPTYLGRAWITSPHQAGCAAAVKADTPFDGFSFLKAAKPDSPFLSRGMKSKRAVSLSHTSRGAPMSVRGAHSDSSCPPSTRYALPIWFIHPPLLWQDTNEEGHLLMPDLLFEHSVCSP